MARYSFHQVHTAQHCDLHISATLSLCLLTGEGAHSTLQPPPPKRATLKLKELMCTTAVQSFIQVVLIIKPLYRFSILQIESIVNIFKNIAFNIFWTLCPGYVPRSRIPGSKNTNIFMVLRFKFLPNF